MFAWQLVIRNSNKRAERTAEKAHGLNLRRGGSFHTQGAERCVRVKTTRPWIPASTRYQGDGSGQRVTQGWAQCMRCHPPHRVVNLVKILGKLRDAASVKQATSVRCMTSGYFLHSCSIFLDFKHILFLSFLSNIFQLQKTSLLAHRWQVDKVHCSLRNLGVGQSKRLSQVQPDPEVFFLCHSEPTSLSSWAFTSWGSGSLNSVSEKARGFLLES